MPGLYYEQGPTAYTRRRVTVRSAVTVRASRCARGKVATRRAARSASIGAQTLGDTLPARRAPEGAWGFGLAGLVGAVIPAT